MLDTLTVLGADKHLEIATDADEEIKTVRKEGIRTLQALDKVSFVPRRSGADFAGQG